MPRSSNPTPFGRTAATRGAAFCGIIVLGGFIADRGSTLWNEIKALRAELHRSEYGSVVGYTGISPKFSTAARPVNWAHDDGGRLALWAGWDPATGHRWFRVRTGELDRRRLGLPIGRDMLRAIDEPLVEDGSGPICTRIPASHYVQAVRVNGCSCAYPEFLLDKVHIINDAIGPAPFLVVSGQGSLGGPSLYAAALDGRRVFMGFSGLFYEGRPLLYDRKTEGLWIERDDGLVALTGPDRGALLRRIVRPRRMRWSDWQREHADGRVLVGADRDTGNDAPEVAALR